jgi:hypothetical protein
MLSADHGTLNRFMQMPRRGDMVRRQDKKNVRMKNKNWLETIVGHLFQNKSCIEPNDLVESQDTAFFFFLRPRL